MSEKLFNLTELAEELGVPYQYVKDASTAKLPLFGGRTTCLDAMAWFRANPDFRDKARLIRANQKTPKKRRGKPPGPDLP